MKILNLIKEIKIDFAQGIIIPDSGSELEYKYEIMPKEFLSFSKKDIKDDSKRGNINSLTNSKRAIDCQTDKIFSSLGLDPNKFPNVIQEYIEKSENFPVKNDLPIRLKFLQAMSFVPVNLISNTRTLRNKLEHFYKNPKPTEVAEAIELAELFILATDNKLKILWDFQITDKEKNEKSEGHLWNSIYVTFDYNKHLFNIRGYTGKTKHKELEVRNTHIEFYYLLKIATSFDYFDDVHTALVDFIKFIEHPIPKEHIKFELE